AEQCKPRECAVGVIAAQPGPAALYRGRFDGRERRPCGRLLRGDVVRESGQGGCERPKPARCCGGSHELSAGEGSGHVSSSPLPYGFARSRSATRRVISAGASSGIGNTELTLISPST